MRVTASAVVDEPGTVAITAHGATVPDFGFNSLVIYVNVEKARRLAHELLDAANIAAMCELGHILEPDEGAATHADLHYLEKLGE